MCLKALKDVNLPKLTTEDVPLFNSIISDLFPGVEEPQQDISDLLEKVKEGCAEMRIVSKEYFMGKVV